MARIKDRSYKIPRRSSQMWEVFNFILSEWGPKRKRLCLTPLLQKLKAETVAPEIFKLRRRYGFIIWRNPRDPGNYVRVRFLPGTTWSDDQQTIELPQIPPPPG